MSESALQSAVVKLLTAAGWLVTRVHAGYVRGRKSARAGTADLVACVRGTGKYIEIEIKTPDGKLRDAQLKRMRDVVANGGEYQVVRSIEDARGLVERMAR